MSNKKIDLGSISFSSVVDKIKNGTAEKGKNRINTHSKMKRSQAIVGGMFSDAYGETYIQTPGSGAFGTFNVGKLSKEDASVLCGDIRVSNCLLTIEVKCGYENVNIESLFLSGKKNSVINEWIKQIGKEAAQTKNDPVLCWKRSKGSPWVIFVMDALREKIDNYFSPLSSRFYTDRFTIYLLSDFLSLVPKKCLFKSE